MPELTVYRKDNAPPPMVCMYCGAPATTATEWREVNRKPSKGAGGDGTNLCPPVVGDDPVSAAIGIVLLPIVLWELLKGLAAGVGAIVGYFTRPRPRPRPVPKPAPKPQELPTTRIVVTVCDRHRRFRDRFVWAGLAGTIPLAALWTWAVLETRKVMGTEDVDLAVALVISAILATIGLPLGLAIWYAFAGPVIVERVTEGTVVLDRVRQPYFDATGLKPTEVA